MSDVVSPILIVSMVSVSDSGLTFLGSCLMADRKGCVQSVCAVVVTLMDLALLLSNSTGCCVLLVTSSLPFVMLTNCGSGQWCGSQPSISTV